GLVAQQRLHLGQRLRIDWPALRNRTRPPAAALRRLEVNGLAFTHFDEPLACPAARLRCACAALPFGSRAARPPPPATLSVYSTDLSSLPIAAGLRVTLMPHSSITASFSSAVPLPPETMAPAWPMRLPGGAVRPAMKPTTGFFMLALTQRAHSSSFEPPISPTMITASVC